MTLQSPIESSPYRSDDRHSIGVLLLLISILVVYSNTLHVTWHLDDYHSIVNNRRLHLDELRPEALVRTFFAAPDSGAYLGNKIFRPISSLTFAINWYFHRFEVFGYHLVNLLIHFFSAWILFATIRNLFGSPRLLGTDESTAWFVSLLAAALWALNPIQTQAVTYIVQRMASLTALFYLLGLLFYVKGRLIDFGIKRILFLLGWVLCFFLALGSKENAITYPFAIVLVEMCFFRSDRRVAMSRVAAWGTLAACLAVVGALTWYFLDGDPFKFLNGYNSRPFTLTERLMTESRIIWLYMSLIFFPLPSRLSIGHDIALSTGWLEPWTTLPAAAAIVAIIVVSLLVHRRWPIPAFAVLFFFLNHMVESTIIPLELVFEHRNYLPSMFLFFPVAFGMKKILDWASVSGKWLYTPTGLFIALIIGLFGIGTYERNKAWATPQSLWQDAMLKAPGNARPVQNLAALHYEKIGELDTAFSLYEKALNLKDPNPAFNRALLLGNMGAICYKKKEYSRASEYFRKAIKEYPRFEKVRYKLIMALMQTGDWEEASWQADKLLKKRPKKLDYLNIKGRVLLRQDQPIAALVYFNEALERAPNFKDGLLGGGAALCQVGQHEPAESLLRRARALDPTEILVYFLLVENRLGANDKAGVDTHLNTMLKSFSLDYIKNRLNKAAGDPRDVPFAREPVAGALAGKLEQEARELVTSAVGPEG